MNARQHVAEWIAAEMAYADSKYDRTADDQQLATEGLAPGGYWEADILNRLRRAHLLGLDTQLGRQALAKTAMTLIACVEAAVRLYGEIPPAGVPSGELPAA